MNLKRGINRLVWVVSSMVASFVLLLGSSRLNVKGLINAYTDEHRIESIVLAMAAFGFVWLLYALSIHIYRGFQDDNHNNKGTTPFWEWVTGRFSPENDPYRKKSNKKK
ncbi:hypothetical protein ES703_31636 [subsurface metagenome]